LKFSLSTFTISKKSTMVFAILFLTASATAAGLDTPCPMDTKLTESCKCPLSRQQHEYFADELKKNSARNAGDSDVTRMGVNKIFSDEKKAALCRAGKTCKAHPTGCVLSSAFPYGLSFVALALLAIN